MGNIRAALEWSFGPDGDDEIATRLAAASAQLFLELSQLIECRVWAERAIARLADRHKNSRREMEIYAALALALMHELIVNDWLDHDYLAQYTLGWDALREEKRKYDQIHANDPEHPFRGLINIQCDKKIPFKVIKKLMFACNQSGFGTINFAAMAKSGAKPADATTPAAVN